MDKLPAWRRYLRFWGPNVDADVDDELRFHLDMRIREFEARGMSAAEARRAALERFGDVHRIEGELRDHDRRCERGRQRRDVMSDLSYDIRYALRSLRRSPVFTVVAVLTLSLGIGATTAIFSVVHGVLLTPLPFPDAGRLVIVWMDNRRMGMSEDIHSWPNYVDLRTQNQVFTDLAGYGGGGQNVTGGCPEDACEPQRVGAAFTTANLFSVLGVSPALGRTYTSEEEEPGNEGVVVISHGLWTRLLAADSAAIGRTIRLNGRERTVIGIMPRGFAFPEPDTDLWVPLALPPQAREARSSYFLRVVGRLKPGVTLERAQLDMSVLAQRLEMQYPVNRDLGVNLEPLTEEVVGRTLRTALWVMLGAVGAVLLIACANVANLLLSRAAVREREIGVRVALGAGRLRLVRQLLTESVLLAILGGALGIFLAWTGLRLLTGIAPAEIPRLEHVRIDVVVLLVTLGISMLTGVVFGLVPALHASRSSLTDALRESGRGGTAGRRGHRMRRGLAVAQVALVVVLLTGAGLLFRSYLQLQQVDLGFRPERLLTMRLALTGASYQSPEQRIAFFDALLERLRQVAGAAGAGAISDIFLSQTPTSTTFTIEGRPRTLEMENIEVPLDAVTPDYFRVMGIPLLRGRTFTEQDARDGPQVAIINENMARRFWPDEDPVGKRFKYGGPESEAPWNTIVGVVGDMRRTGYDAPVRYETFRPYTQRAVGQMTVVVRTTREPLTLAPSVREVVRSIDPELPVFQVSSMDERLAAMVAQRRFSMTLLGVFAALALVLGLVGVYGVTSYLVAQRTREFGLRIALGADPARVVRLVVGQGMLVAGIGVALGLAGALALTRLMASLLYDVSPTDFATLAAVTALLVMATLLANYVPARRAARADPLAALRAD